MCPLEVPEEDQKRWIDSRKRNILEMSDLVSHGIDNEFIHMAI